MKLTELTLTGFLEKTYGSDPVPGGGSISALCGALAAALGQMVTALTIGRKKYSDVEDDMLRLAPEMEEACGKFTSFIDEDAAAYQVVFDAFKMPKDTEEEKTLRKEAIQRATLAAALVPLEVARTAVGIMDSIQEIAVKGNRNAVTDCCVAMMCARTAALGAILNVRINLASLDDREMAAGIEEECIALHDEAEIKEAALLNTVMV